MILWFYLLVAGEGLEPPTSGLWARRATNCSIPRYAAFRSVPECLYKITQMAGVVKKNLLTEFNFFHLPPVSCLLNKSWYRFTHTPKVRSQRCSQQKPEVFIENSYENGPKDKSPAHTGMAELSVEKDSSSLRSSEWHRRGLSRTI